MTVYSGEVYYATFAIAFPTQRLAAVAMPWQAYGDNGAQDAVLQNMGGTTVLSQIHCKLAGSGTSKTLAYIACGY